MANSRKINRINIWNKYRRRCAYCGHKITLEEMEIDHIHPKSKSEDVEFNINHYDNLNPSCYSCNKAKSDRSISEFKKYLNSFKKSMRENFAVGLAFKYSMIAEQNVKITFFFERVKPKENVKYSSTRRRNTSVKRR